MTTGTGTDPVTPCRSRMATGEDRFTHLLHAEWTKFRTVRGWVCAMVAAALVTVALSLLTASMSHSSCGQGPVEIPCPAAPVGPDGTAVEDKFTFAHQVLTGDGGITARLTSMTGVITYPPPDHDKIVPGLVPWAKAGLIVKDSTRQGSTYAAVMVTARHGARMQHDFVHDTAGRPQGVSAETPRWLRLTRSGRTLTGYESSDGIRWTRVGTARLPRLGATARIGLFVTSPGDLTVRQGELGGVITEKRFTQATAVFDNVSMRGGVAGAAWDGDDIRAGGGKTDWEKYHHPGGVVRSGGTFTVTGSGDIAPTGEEAGRPVESALAGALPGLVIVIVVAVLFITAEHRRGLIAATVLATPRRGRVLVAKTLVIAGATFAAGLAATAVALPLSTRILRANGNLIHPVSMLTELRVIVGTAALLAVAAVFALAVGSVLRRGVVAAVTALVLIVVPYVLAVASVLPDEAARWLLRVTPAAGFAIQQSVPAYAHVLDHYAPAAGYFPLAPGPGFAVLCGHAALALAVAAVSLHRRDV